MRVGYTGLYINDSLRILNENYLGENGNELSYAYLSYEYRYDKVDNFQYPLRGKKLLARVSKQGLGITNSINQLEFLAMYQHFFRLKPKVFFDVAVSGRLSSPRQQLYPLVTGLGYGLQFVRGYQLNVIDGQHYGLLRSNLKYKIFEKEFDLKRLLKIKQLNTVPVASFLKVFVDIGAVRNFYPELSNSTLSNRLLWGGGLGMDVVTFYNTSVDLNYSFNQTGAGGLYFTARRAL